MIFEEIANAICKLSRQKNGCLIAIEREAKLKTYIESGVELDCIISSEMLLSIFSNQSPLHDGGIIIRGERIIAASCLFPLSENTSLSKVLGTRHRAALGLSEQTDTIVIVVSEETSEISVATDGRFIPIKDKEQLINTLKHLLMNTGGKK